MTDTRRLSDEVRQYLRSNKDMLDDLTRDAFHDLDVADAQIKSAALESAERSADLAAAQAKVAVLDGSWCAENQAEGRNVCGVCKNCLRAKITMLEGVIACLVRGHGEYPTNLDQMAAEYTARIRADERRRLLSLLADDGFAMTFQTTGQYRSALIRALAAQPEKAGE